MSEAETACPKCDGEMVRGFVIDHSHEGILIGQWAKGEPQKSFWTGLKNPGSFATLPVGTFRCESCGFLESYARKEFAAK